MSGGAMGETCARLSAGAAAAMTSGPLYLTAIPLLAGTVVTNITYITGLTAASGPTHWWYGLYDSSLNQLAVTADQTTAAMAASTAYTLPVATGAGGSITSYTIGTSGLYYLGFVMVATVTMPSLMRLAV